MAALQCEICGGKLMAKAGGIFECDSCGMQYDKSRVQEMVQEIKGTVKVEGTVEVQGTVQVDNATNKENMIKRANICLADGEWDKANEILEQVLNMDPECGEAYLGKFLAEQKAKTVDDVICETFKLIKNRNYQRAKQYATGDTAELITRLESNSEKITLKKLSIRKKLSDPFCGIGISAGLCHVVGLCADGTVLALGENGFKQNDAEYWQNIVAISASSNHTVGLYSDGNVVACGDNSYGQCDVDNWHNIVAITVGGYHTVGLRADGRVVACGNNSSMQCEVNDWRDVTAISANSDITVGLCADGHVVACGKLGANEYLNWENIVAVSAGHSFIIGLCADGHVVACGSDAEHYYGVDMWADIIAIASGYRHILGLCADGHVVACGSNKCGECNTNTWKQIAGISAGIFYSVGIGIDGSVISCGCDVDHYSWGQVAKDARGVDRWQIFHNEEEIDKNILLRKNMVIKLRENAIKETAAEEERRAKELIAKAKYEEQQRLDKIAALKAEQARLQTELPNIKGLFSSGRRKEVGTRLAEIEADLKSLNG